MNHRITIRPVKHEPPDLDRFVAALLALAIARVEADKAESETEAPAEPKEARG